MYYKAELNKSTPSSHTGFGQLYIWKLHVLCLTGPCWVLQGMQATQQTDPGTSTAFMWVVLPLRDGIPPWICYRDISPQFVCFATEINKKPGVALFFFLQLSILFFQLDLGTPREQWLPWEQRRQEPESTGNSLRTTGLSVVPCVCNEKIGMEMSWKMEWGWGKELGKARYGQERQGGQIMAAEVEFGTVGTWKWAILLEENGAKWDEAGSGAQREGFCQRWKILNERRMMSAGARCI